MKRHIYIALLLCAVSVVAFAQTEHKRPASWTIGAGMRLGFGSMMQEAEGDGDHNTGFDGAIDGVYTYFFRQKNVDLPFFGIRTGLSLGFRQNSMKMKDIDITYQAADAQGNTITYHATVDRVKETDRDFSIEVPIMFAALYKTYYANLGLRFGAPLLSRYKQTMENPTLTATYDDFGVTISGERVTGRVSADDGNRKAKLDASSFNMCLSFEGGYIFSILGSKLSAGMYVDYGLVDNYKGKGKHFTDADPSAIDGASNTPTSVAVHSLTESYVSSVGVFAIGVRGVYDLPKWLFQRSNKNRENYINGKNSTR